MRKIVAEVTIIFGEVVDYVGVDNLLFEKILLVQEEDD